MQHLFDSVQLTIARWDCQHHSGNIPLWKIRVQIKYSRKDIRMTDAISILNKNSKRILLLVGGKWFDVLDAPG